MDTNRRKLFLTCVFECIGMGLRVRESGDAILGSDRVGFGVREGWVRARGTEVRQRPQRKNKNLKVGLGRIESDRQRRKTGSVSEGEP